MQYDWWFFSVFLLAFLFFSILFLLFLTSTNKFGMHWERSFSAGGYIMRYFILFYWKWFAEQNLGFGVVDEFAEEDSMELESK